MLDDDGDGAEGGALAHRVGLLGQDSRAVRRVPRSAGEGLVEHRAATNLDLKIASIVVHQDLRYLFIATAIH